VGLAVRLSLGASGQEGSAAGSMTYDATSTGDRPGSPIRIRAVSGFR